MVKDIRPGPEDGDPGDFVVIGGTVYFTAETLESGEELWKTTAPRPAP